MKRAYILVTVKPLWIASVIRMTKRLKMVDRVDVISGPYDLMVTVIGDTFDSVSDFIIEELRKIDGIEHTETWMVMVPHEKEQ